MKALLRKTARNMSTWPGIGRLVRIGVAVIRLPEFRAAYDEAQRRQQSVALPEVVQAAVPVEPVQPPAPVSVEPLMEPVSLAAISKFEAEQLPALLQAISDIKHLQVATSHERHNLEQSVPVALRKLTRDISELTRQDQLHNGQAEMQATQVDALTQRVERFANEIQDLAGSVSYLLGRVEFVRRELMFEMRYGAGSAASEKDAIEPQVIAVDKVDAARRTGLRLNLGCGHVPLAGYINVDRRALPGVDVVADIDKLPFGQGELAEISSAHMLEHFPLEQLRRELLPYWKSLLGPQGKFRAIVPDGAAMARAFVSQEYDFDNFRQVTFGGQDYDGDFHFTMFSTESMTTLLTEAGFHAVEVVAENRENSGCKEFEIVAYL